MDIESAMDEITDLIAIIEVHRQEIEKESGREASRNYALPKLRQALLQAQEASQLNGASSAGLAVANALSAEIGRVEALGGNAAKYPAAAGKPPSRPQQPSPDARRGSSKNQGRRTMGRRGGR